MTSDSDAVPSLPARHARHEAQAVVGDGFFARTLEPSPPAVDDGDFFADDPVAAGPAPEGAGIVSPVPNGDLTWDDWVSAHPEHMNWAAARWLGGKPRLPAPPSDLAVNRLAAHRLAVYALSAARRRINGKIGLRFTLGGFGTPFFGRDEQVRLAGTDLVRQQGSDARMAPVTTLGEAAGFLLDGPPDDEWAKTFDVPEAGDPDTTLDLTAEGAAFLGEWYGFAYSVLENLRADTATTGTSRVQIWPEHFDAAFEGMPGNRRAGFGASPGDAGVDEPYLYVGPWEFDAVPRSELWNAQSFNGAILRLSEFVKAADQRAEALAFFRSARDLLSS